MKIYVGLGSIVESDLVSRKSLFEGVVSPMFSFELSAIDTVIFVHKVGSFALTIQWECWFPAVSSICLALCCFMHQFPFCFPEMILPILTMVL